MQILAFAASNSRQSINKQLVTHAATVLTSEVAPDATVDIIDLNDFEMPIYSADREAEGGIPDLARDFRAHIAKADALMISFAEHNGTYSAAFKNIFDWASRLEGKVWSDKPMLCLATSPGGRGGLSVLTQAESQAPRLGAILKASLSVPSFYETFDSATGTLTDPDLQAQLRDALAALIAGDPTP